MVKVVSLSDVIAELLRGLTEREAPLPEGVFVVESALKCNPDGRWIVSRESVTTPQLYEARFEELQSQGRAWLNVSDYGLFDGTLLVGIEAGKPGEMDGPPKINLSGPTNKVRDANWDVSKEVVFVP